MTTKNSEDALIIGIQKWIRGTLARKSLLVTMPKYSDFIFRKRNRENYGSKIVYDSSLIFDDFATELRRHKLKSTDKRQETSNAIIEEKPEEINNPEKKSEENVTINKPEIKENIAQDEKIVNSEENFKENLEDKKIENKVDTENYEKANLDYLDLKKLNEVERKSIQGISVRADYSPDSSHRDSIGSDIDGDISPELSKDISARDVNTSRQKDILNSDIEDISDIEKEEIGAVIKDKSYEEINGNELQEEKSSSSIEEKSASDKEEIYKSDEKNMKEDSIQMENSDEKSEKESSDIIDKNVGKSSVENSAKSLQVDQIKNKTENEMIEREEKGQNEKYLLKENVEKSDAMSENKGIEETGNISEDTYKVFAVEEEKVKINEENTISMVENSDIASEKLKNKDLVEFQNKELQEKIVETENKDSEILENKQYLEKEKMDEAAEIPKYKEYLDKDLLKSDSFKDSDKIENHKDIEKEYVTDALINEPNKEIILANEKATIERSQENEVHSNRFKRDISIKNERPAEENILGAAKEIINDNQNAKENEVNKNEKDEEKKLSPKENQDSSLENKYKEVQSSKQISKREILKESQAHDSEMPSSQQNLSENLEDKNSIKEIRDTPIKQTPIESRDTPIQSIPRETKNEENSDLTKHVKNDPVIKSNTETKLEKSNSSNSSAQSIEKKEIENTLEKSESIPISKSIAKDYIKDNINQENLGKNIGQHIIKNPIEPDEAEKLEAEKSNLKRLAKSNTPNILNANQIDAKNEYKIDPQNQPSIVQESSISSANSKGNKINNTAEISAEFPIKTEFTTANKDSYVQVDAKQIKQGENQSNYLEKENNFIEKVSEDLLNRLDQENLENEDKPSNTIRKYSYMSEEEEEIYLNESKSTKNKIKNIEKDFEEIEDQKDYKVFEQNEKSISQSEIEKDQNSYERIHLDSKSARKNSIKANISITENKPNKKKNQNVASKNHKPAIISNVKSQIISEKRKEFNTPDHIINHKAEEIPENRSRANSDFLQHPPPKKFDSSSKQPFHRNFLIKRDQNTENKDKKDRKSSSQSMTPSRINELEESKGFNPKSNKNLDKNISNELLTEQEFQSQNPLFNPPSQSGISSNDPSTPIWSQTPNEYMQKDIESMLRKNFYQNQELRGSKNPILPHLDQPTLNKKRSPKSQEFFENPIQKISNEPTNLSSTPSKFKSRSLNQTHCHVNPYTNDPTDLNFDPNIYKSKKSKTKNSKELDDLTNPKTAGQSKKSTSYGKYRFQYNIQPKSSTNVLVLDKGSPYELEKGMKMLQEFFGVKVDIIDNNHKKKIRIIKPKLQNIKLPAIKPKKVLKKGDLVL